MADRHPHWTQSLLARTVLGVIVVAALTTAVLFLSIDYVVTRQFEQLHAERSERAARQIEASVATELRRLDNLSRLLVNDADLVNSSYYHLYLEGELEHPQAAVNRIAAAFSLASVALWTPDARLVTESRGTGMPGPVPPVRGTASPAAGLTAVGDTVWLISRGTLEHNTNPIAWLVLGVPLGEVLAGLEQTYGATIRRAGEESPVGPDESRALLELDNDATIDLAVRIPDTVAHALSQVKRLLAVLMPLATLLLAVSLALLLRWQLRPVSALATSIGAVGRGDFRQRLPVPPGSGEVGQLVRAFNRMSADLQHLKEMERRLQHQEQLSAIGKVAARVAHDINNPLSVISSAQALLSRQLSETDPSREYVNLIRHHTERCIRTVENLLEFGRPIHPRLETVDPVGLIEGILRRWARHDFGEYPLVLHSDGAMPSIHADPMLFEQMLDNLLENARLAAPGEPVEVHLSASRDRLLVEVVDAGPGFSPESREHLFEPFFTTRKGGTGLGLASCLAIARAHDGEIEIGPGPGGRVRVLWPVR
ncbi:hypothetical protein THITH_16845 [Thioalkalivibrio paradoxus ARh 1]|uniref:histidine kinase n=1 Tax=Thioalkalivibrio paradoxus ARh 1 TaxID=713585 RepID=W0DTW5_9GAMM|nr:hypothetical protein THITH_16845 [Thioalkalivibrio paradoxus ARh 1]